MDIYGRVRIEQGEVGLVPFLYQGQYLDTETGLAYNRFRYYSAEIGAYISQDPIRLEAGLTNLYAYVHDVNAWVDPWGLKSDYIQIPRILGYQKHHIITKSTKHPLLDRLGFDVQQHKNIIHLPTSSSIDPTRTVHTGRHTSNYNKMILSRLDEIEALDADDIRKRMHVNDLMENTGDDLRNNRIRLNNH